MGGNLTSSRVDLPFLFGPEITMPSDQGAKFFPNLQQKLVDALHLSDTNSIVPYRFDEDGDCARILKKVSYYGFLLPDRAVIVS